MRSKNQSGRSQTFVAFSSDFSFFKVSFLLPFRFHLGKSFCNWPANFVWCPPFEAWIGTVWMDDACATSEKKEEEEEEEVFKV